jgi:hypothetical protein
MLVSYYTIQMGVLLFQCSIVYPYVFSKFDVMTIIMIKRVEPKEKFFNFQKTSREIGVSRFFYIPVQ